MQWAKQKQSGFTIVELLIVVVVIAILAAITIVAYNGIQNRANDSVVQSDLKNFFNKSMAYATENAYSYPYTPIATLTNLNFKASKGAYATSPQSGINLSYCANNSAPTRIGIIAMSKSGKKFYISTDSGSVKEYTGAWDSAAALPNCAGIDAALTSSFTGYVATDSTTGPWRLFVGGN